MASVCSPLPLSSLLPLPVDFKLSVQGNQTTEPVRNGHVTEYSLMTGLSCVWWGRAGEEMWEVAWRTSCTCCVDLPQKDTRKRLKGVWLHSWFKCRLCLFGHIFGI